MHLLLVLLYSFPTRRSSDLMGWQPVMHFFNSFPREELVAFYNAADIVWVTPLRDGLNLVAKRSEEHTSELQSRGHLVCRLLLEQQTPSASMISITISI